MGLRTYKEIFATLYRKLFEIWMAAKQREKNWPSNTKQKQQQNDGRVIGQRRRATDWTQRLILAVTGMMSSQWAFNVQTERKWMLALKKGEKKKQWMMKMHFCVLPILVLTYICVVVEADVRSFSVPRGLGQHTWVRTSSWKKSIRTIAGTSKQMEISQS